MRLNLYYCIFLDCLQSGCALQAGELLPYLCFFSIFSGDHSEEVTPVPMPNTEVKGLSGDGTATFGRGRVARRRIFIYEALLQ